jgi:hypothetical protein
MSKETILGYFYRKSTESPRKALDHYDIDRLHKSVEETERWIGYDKNQGVISKNVKPVILKLSICEVNQGENNEG